MEDAVPGCDNVCDSGKVNDVFGHCDGGNLLQNAIDLAAEGSTLDVPAGTYVGPFTIDKSLTLNGVDQNTVFIENADISSDVVLVCYSSGAECDVTIQNVTIRNGRYGIYSKSTGAVNVLNSTFYHNGYDGKHYLMLGDSAQLRLTMLRYGLQSSSSWWCYEN